MLSRRFRWCLSLAVVLASSACEINPQPPLPGRGDDVGPSSPGASGGSAQGSNGGGAPPTSTAGSGTTASPGGGATDGTLNIGLGGNQPGETPSVGGAGGADEAGAGGASESGAGGTSESGAGGDGVGSVPPK